MAIQTRNTNGGIESDLVKAHSVAALAMLLLAAFFGIAVSLQFFAPDFLNGLLPSWGRMRFVHTQGIMLGWLGNAFIAFLYYCVPILTSQPIRSRRLGIVIFALWNFAIMIPGFVLVLAGYSQPLEWAEFPLFTDALVMLAFLLLAIQFLPAFFSNTFDSLYVSSWYIIGALVFTLLSYPMGNFVPEFVPGAAGAAFSGLWIHDAVGLFVTPLALAILYFVIPASTGKPIFSHFLSMLGFWGLFFIYPLNGIHHYIYSAIPMAAQLAAIFASFILGVVVIAVVSNLMLSQRGAGLFPQEISLRFASMAVVFYLLVSLQGSLQADMELNALTHFTDWVIGHSHLAMLGFATFAGIAGIVHAWQRLPEARFNSKMLNWAYWLLTVGITLMVVDLTIAGLVQGQLWQAGAPWLDSIRASQPYWIIRSLSALPVVAGFTCLLSGLVSGSDTLRNGTAQTVEAQAKTVRSDSPPREPNLALRNSYLVASVAGIGFFVLSVTLLGVLPLQALEKQSAMLTEAEPLPLSPSAQRGRELYSKEGCGYCHTQQVRFVEADVARYGAPSLAWEGRLDYPHLLGTRRIGPDLSRAGNVRTSQWHLAHLYAPRSVVPDSIMPAYPEFFAGGPLAPSQEALDLVAYLETLGRERELAWPEGDRRAALATNDPMLSMSLRQSPLNTNPARTQPRGNAPSLARVETSVAGVELWQTNCSGCHGDTGQGNGQAAEWLQPQPANLTQHDYSADLLADVLWNGVHGTSMPAWRELNASQLSALVAVVKSFSEVKELASTSRQLSSGQRVYETHCAECHGANGDGNGFAAGSLPIPILPADFTGERLTLNESLRALTLGVPGSSMAPWGDRLSEEEMNNVSHYIRSFFAEVSEND
ncbi:MAG: cbb3-type cytochrome c oxidase subunit I [Pseudohongiellaceae bacterium]